MGSSEWKELPGLCEIPSLGTAEQQISAPHFGGAEDQARGESRLCGEHTSAGQRGTRRWWNETRDTHGRARVPVPRYVPIHLQASSESNL